MPTVKTTEAQARAGRIRTGVNEVLKNVATYSRERLTKLLQKEKQYQAHVMAGQRFAVKPLGSECVEIACNQLLAK